MTPEADTVELALPPKPPLSEVLPSYLAEPVTLVMPPPPVVSDVVAALAWVEHLDQTVYAVGEDPINVGDIDDAIRQVMDGAARHVDTSPMCNDARAAAVTWHLETGSTSSALLLLLCILRDSRDAPLRQRCLQDALKMLHADPM